MSDDVKKALGGGMPGVNPHFYVKVPGQAGNVARMRREADRVSQELVGAPDTTPRSPYPVKRVSSPEDCVTGVVERPEARNRVLDVVRDMGGFSNPVDYLMAVRAVLTDTELEPEARQVVLERVRELWRSSSPMAKPYRVRTVGETLQKAQRPHGKGWQPIPRGRKGGFRRRGAGGKWEYWYPESTPAPKKKSADDAGYRSGAVSRDGKGMRVLSLFSGIGGLELGFTKALPKGETVAFVEQNKFAQKVLKKNFPGVPVMSDVVDVAKSAKAGKLELRPNVVTGGFPCQDLSGANQSAKGLKGSRSGLYHKMRDIVESTNPDWVVYENVPQLRNRGLEVLLADHLDMGYEVSWDGVTAQSVGAPHYRDRIFVVAHRPGVDFRFREPQRFMWDEAIPKMDMDLSRGHDDDHAEKIAAAGNAIVPDVGRHIAKMIGESSPGSRDLSHEKVFATWDGEAWRDGKGKAVKDWPRAGVMRGDTVYQVDSAVPKVADPSDHVREGDLVWVKNPTPAALEWDVPSFEEATIIDAAVMGRDIFNEEGGVLEDFDAGALAEAEANGYIEVDYSSDPPTVEATWVGESALERAGAWSYRGEGGVNDAFVGRVYYDNGDLLDIELPNGEIEPFSREYVSLFPTPTKTDYKGGMGADVVDEELSPTYDPMHEKRKRGGQTRHWVTEQVNPEFQRHLMGFPEGWMDVEPDQGTLFKAEKPPGGGWQAMGKQGGFHRKKGDKFEYWYPDGKGVRGAKKGEDSGDQKKKPGEGPEAESDAPAEGTITTAQDREAFQALPSNVQDKMMAAVQAAKYGSPEEKLEAIKDLAKTAMKGDVSPHDLPQDAKTIMGVTRPVPSTTMRETQKLVDTLEAKKELQGGSKALDAELKDAQERVSKLVEQEGVLPDGTVVSKQPAPEPEAGAEPQGAPPEKGKPSEGKPEAKPKAKKEGQGDQEPDGSTPQVPGPFEESAYAKTVDFASAVASQWSGIVASAGGEAGVVAEVQNHTATQQMVEHHRNKVDKESREYRRSADKWKQHVSDTAKREHQRVLDSGGSAKEANAAVDRVKRAAQDAFDAVNKSEYQMQKSSGGWQPIPGGRKGKGMRRRKADGSWEYQYENADHAKTALDHHHGKSGGAHFDAKHAAISHLKDSGHLVSYDHDSGKHKVSKPEGKGWTKTSSKGDHPQVRGGYGDAMHRKNEKGKIEVHAHSSEAASNLSNYHGQVAHQHRQDGNKAKEQEHRELADALGKHAKKLKSQEKKMSKSNPLLVIDVASIPSDRLEKSLGIHAGGRRVHLLSKAEGGPKPPGSGWQPIPGGTKGGFRKKKGSGYEYWYPDEDGGGFLKRMNLKVTGGKAELLNRIADAMKGTIDLCQITPPTCEKNLGVPRKDMPQIPGDKKKAFFDKLKDKGVKVEVGERQPGSLSATQDEMLASKIVGMVKAYKSGDFKNLYDDPIMISNDGHVLDGHHRWAAMLLNDPKKKMNVVKIDMPIRELLKETDRFEGTEKRDLTDSPKG